MPYLTIEDFIQLKDWFIYIDTLKRRFGCTVLKKYFNKLSNYNNTIQEIDAKIDEDCQIRDQASEELLKIRIKKKRLNKKIRNTLSNLLLKRANLFSDTNVVERESRYVLPVKRNFKKDIPGIVYSYSNSGETVFIEPAEISDDSAKLIELDNREKEEIGKILRLLTDIVHSQVDKIEQDIEVIIDLDLLYARVCFANEFNATMPVFGGYLKVVNGYHPILKRFNKDVVPLNIEMNSKKGILLISGPNAGGKTVVLKTVGLIAQMAKCGIFIPVDEGSTIPFFREVYADIGDEQSIESNLSTFAAHIKQIKEALDAGENSLVLLDELMSQTSVEEGSALAQSVLEDFAKKHTTVLATTHNENLKIFVNRRPDMMNGGMEFTDKPTYRLILGIPQPSNAIALARNLGIDKDVIQNALEYLDEDKMSLNKLFEDLSKEMKQINRERKKLSVLIDEYEAKLIELNTKKKKKLDELKAKYKREFIQSKRSIEKLVKDLKREGPKPETVRKMREFFDSRLQSEETYAPYYPHIGEIVRVRELRKVGQVIEEHSGKFKVSLENIFYWVGPEEIESIGKDN